jgi:tRNA U34 5-carboxymethylaminomethyl modifying GTPase MnmE/TrmE
MIDTDELRQEEERQFALTRLKGMLNEPVLNLQQKIIAIKHQVATLSKFEHDCLTEERIAAIKKQLSFSAKPILKELDSELKQSEQKVRALKSLKVAEEKIVGVNKACVQEEVKQARFDYMAEFKTLNKQWRGSITGWITRHCKQLE